MLYFYPVKVNTTQEDLKQKKDELELYQNIINRTFAFIQDRIEENHQKQTLVEELNKYVGESVQEILEEEKVFYESDTKDKLKVPPFTKVKRIPRDYTNEQNIVNEYKKQNELASGKKKGTAKKDQRSASTSPER